MSSGLGAPDSWQTVPLARLKGTLFQPYERSNRINISIIVIDNDLMDRWGERVHGGASRTSTEFRCCHLQCVTGGLTAQYCSTDVDPTLICAVRPSTGEFYS